ncbi:hypothetical protein FA13DRAFT_1460478 [Coprinellus micaceus]|uniref:Uncharacterized protein n=1 Tax=Coprinellus micaceus TaxID=71717 RepID=A0A4Y7SM63_COPMI|nr:hypothetical protein FA13DRAFT_1460478 [Coprinellus micaceus]
MRSKSPSITWRSRTDPSSCFLRCRGLGQRCARLDYATTDAEWWLGCLGSGSFSVSPCLQHMFWVVHTRCCWYRCLPSCKVWRKQMFEYSNQRKLPAPGKFEIFCDKYGVKI